MAITDYGELKTAVADWLERDDLASNIPDFIALAEDRIRQDQRIRIRAMETSTALTVDAQTVALPTNYVAARRIYLDGTPLKRLEYLTPENFWIRNLANQTGLPKFYTVEAEDLVFGPSPDSSRTGRFLYFQSFAPLVADIDTNWILTNARGLLLYGALIESAPFLDDDIRTLTWATLYDDTAENVAKANKKDRYEAGAPLQARSDVNPDARQAGSGSLG